MNWQTSRLWWRGLGFIGILSFAVDGFAQNGKLPQGMIRSQSPLLVVDNSQYKVKECFQYFLHRQNASYFQTQDMKSLFFMTALAGRNFDADRRYLLRFDQGTLQLFRKLTVPTTSSSVMMPVNHSIDGLTFVTFFHDDGCYAGPASAVGVSFSNAKASQSLLTDAPYFLTRISGLPAVADLSQLYAVIIGNVSFQKRRVFKFAKDEWPLEYNGATNELVVLKRDGGQPARGRLIRRSVAESKVMGELLLDLEERVIQQNHEFAAVTPVVTTNEVLIREAKDWSNTIDERHRLTLPKEAPVSSAYFDFDFGLNTVLVYGRDPLTGHRWPEAYVFDYKKNQLLGKFSLERGSYVDFGVHRKDQTGAIFIIKSHHRGELVAMRQFAFATKSWKPIHLEIL